MSSNMKHTSICQPYINTNNCPSGDNCILQHVRKESSSQTDKGRTIAILPFSDLRQQIKPKIPHNSKLTDTNNSGKCKTTQNCTSNTNSIHEEFPTLSKAQKKRNRRKGKSNMNDKNNQINSLRINDKNLCANAKSECDEKCNSLHGDTCDLCTRPVLHPFNLNFRREHSQQCVKEHEEHMKQVLATLHSLDKQCGICFEPVMQKEKKGDRRFSILPDCNHCFCLVCIKIWRKSAGFGKAIRKSCPECRVVSHFVCPNTYWVENKEDKLEVIQNYKNTLGRVDCKYFAKNQRCPFGNKCFYKHCNEDGTHVDLGAPWKNRHASYNFLHQTDFMIEDMVDFMMDDDSELSENSVYNYDFQFELDYIEDEYDEDSD